jgi:uncharacterized delta-60 repeat protein
VAGTYETASGSNRLGVLRLTRRGARDPSFEGGGGRLVDVPGVYGEEVTGTAVQSDDRIVLAGHGCEGTQPVVDGSCRRVFVVVRVTPSGATDTTFGGSSGGVVTTSFPSADDAEAYAVTIQPNGRIVVVGAADVDGSARLALVRYRTNGTLDPTFDGDGRVLTNVTTSRDEAAHAVAIQPDGEILVAGVANVGTESAPRYRFALARYRADGSLDPSLDGDSIVITGAGPWNLIATAVALTPNGRIVVAGEARERRPATIHRCSIYRLALVRYLADGRPDPSFDGDGRVLGSDRAHARRPSQYSSTAESSQSGRPSAASTNAACAPTSSCAPSGLTVESTVDDAQTRTFLVEVAPRSQAGKAPLGGRARRGAGSTRFLRSISVPEDDRWFLLYEASSAAEVRAAAERADIDVISIAVAGSTDDGREP